MNSLLQQEVSAILLREVEFPPGMMVTVTQAEVADDAESAKIWISVLPDDRGEDALNIVNKLIGLIQDRLNHRLVMKFVPRLAFKIDRQLVKAVQVTELLDKITDEDPGVSDTNPTDQGPS